MSHDSASLPPQPSPTSENTKIPTPSSLQNALITAVVSALLGGATASGGMTLFQDREVREDVRVVQQELHSLEGKIDEIYRIVDAAHPRRFAPPPGPSSSHNPMP